MKNRILDNLNIIALSVNITGWISRQSLAVRGLARLIKNEGKSLMNFLQKCSLQKIPAGEIRKPAPLKGWRGYLIKKAGILRNSIRDNIIRHAMTKKRRKPAQAADFSEKLIEE